MSKKKVRRVSSAALRDFITRTARAHRLIERGTELQRSGTATDKRVARELFFEARDLAAAVKRDCEKASPVLKALAKALAKTRKRKAST